MIEGENNITLNDHHLAFISDHSKHPVQLDIKKSPSSLMTLWHAFASQKHTYKPGQTLPGIELNRTGIHIDQKHLSTFKQICGYQHSSNISILYPFAMVYPYILRVLSHNTIPLSIFRSLNTRSQLVMHRQIDINDTLDLRIRLSDYRVVEKGIEIDVTASIYTDNSLAWESVFTYYYRGRYGQADDSFKPPRLDPIRNGVMSGQFHIEAKNGFRFARLTGDTNGIHYNSLYARMLGFKGAFAQPLRSVSKCLQSMPENGPEMPVLLKLFYKGPVYYNHRLTLMHVSQDKSFRFDLHSEDDDRSCICGHYQAGVSTYTLGSGHGK